jgi:hypothetical protein
MSRYDYGDPGTDPAYCDDLSDRGVVALCADCGDQFRTTVVEPGAKCDYCWAQRDAHTSALEDAYLLKKMAKAVLDTDLTKVRKVS